MKQGIQIAVSGKSGCGNTTVTRLVAQRLRIQMINYTFHTMAQERGMAFETLCRLAQTDPAYDRELDAKQAAMAAGGNCVLGSRLAVWLLQEADLKVFLTASPEVRAARIFQREGGTLSQQSEQTRLRDERDRERYRRLYQIDHDSYSFCDLIINTDGFSAEAVAEMIVTALRLKQSAAPLPSAASPLSAAAAKEEEE